MKKTSALLVLVAAICLFTPDAAAQVSFGLRAGQYTDIEEPMVGVELITKIAPHWYFNPNIEYVFVDDGDLVTFNADVHYDFTTGSNVLLVWAGGGLAVVHENIVESDTNIGANILGGVGWRLGEVIPYVQAKALLGDRDDFVVAGGIRF
ncbi:MAG: hypothetical protein HYU52_10115 [Acidobacteria bacterium]|nr:hypothetical protein [Acidobacteriota bacterium]